MNRFERELAAHGGVSGIFECAAVGNDAPLRNVIHVAREIIPDLYAALDSLLCMVQMERADSPGDDETPVKRARSALAKARGEA